MDCAPRHRTLLEQHVLRLLDSLAMRTAMSAAVEDRPRWIEVGKVGPVSHCDRHAGQSPHARQAKESDPNRSPRLFGSGSFRERRFRSGELVPVVDEELPDPVDDRAHACRASEVAMHDDPIFRPELGHRWG